MRYMKLGIAALIVALAAIGLLRIADIITSAQVQLLMKMAFAAIVLLMAAGVALNVVTSRAVPDDSADRPIP